MQKTTNITLPDIGDFDEVEVIEILVKVGDNIKKDASIITLESDKASMEIPSPQAGIVEKIAVKIGDKISLGAVILELDPTQTEQEKPEVAAPLSPATTEIAAPPQTSSPLTPPQIAAPDTDFKLPAGSSHASPSIRKLARELGVDLSKVSGSGQKGRILDTDLKGYVKQIITSGGGVLPKVPIVDFAKFGEVETKPLSKIKKISGKHLSACWLNIPHVTQFDEVNIDKIEAFRQQQKSKGVKLTPLVFIMQAVAKTLKKHPNFNASLDETGDNLIIKKYFNLGIAMDTKNGLVVPVIRDVEQKSLTELAAELASISQIARDGKLKIGDMQGATFTISSLGGIGGTQFSPIVNAPEVAILGVSRSKIQPVWDGKKFNPELTLPLALSYDHRVIDGAEGGRFMADLHDILQNLEPKL